MSKFWDMTKETKVPVTIVEYDPNEGVTFTTENPVLFGYLGNEFFIWKIKRIFVNPIKSVTVVIWDDGSKTRVDLADGEKFDLLNAVAAAVMKKKYGNNSAFKAHIKKNLESYNDEAYSCIALYEACQLFHGYEEFKTIVAKKTERSDLRKEINKIKGR